MHEEITKRTLLEGSLVVESAQRSAAQSDSVGQRP